MSHFEPAPRLRGMGVSDIVLISKRAKELAAAGRDVIDLSLGEPDFATPEAIRTAAVAAMDRGETHYTPVPGTADLRAAIQAKLARENHRKVALDQIIAGVGAKQVIANALLATLAPGDEVIIPAPYWTSYADMVRFAGGTPVIVDCTRDEGYLLSDTKLRKAIGPQTRWLMLNSPSNPTGAAYDASQLAELAEVLRDQPQVWVLEDAIYEHLLYDGARYVSLLDVAPDLGERTLWVNGVSKAYAMTGWRIGYGVGPSALIAAMAVVSGQTTSHPCSIAQAAAVAALTGDQAPVRDFAERFARRRAILGAALKRLPGVRYDDPRGAFYAFVDVSELLDRLSLTDRAFADRVLEEAGVAVVPGSSFGAPGHLRISFAASDEALEEAGRRLEDLVLGQLSRQALTV